MGPAKLLEKINAEISFDWACTLMRILYGLGLVNSSSFILGIFIFLLEFLALCYVALQSDSALFNFVLGFLYFVSLLCLLCIYCC